MIDGGFILNFFPPENWLKIWTYEERRILLIASLEKSMELVCFFQWIKRSINSQSLKQHTFWKQSFPYFKILISVFELIFLVAGQSHKDCETQTTGQYRCESWVRSWEPDHQSPVRRWWTYTIPYITTSFQAANQSKIVIISECLTFH